MIKLMCSGLIGMIIVATLYLILVFISAFIGDLFYTIIKYFYGTLYLFCAESIIGVCGIVYYGGEKK